MATINARQESAKIYMFPSGARALSAQSLVQARFAAEAAAVRASDAVCASNWYHDEAIREAELSSKH